MEKSPINARTQRSNSLAQLSQTNEIPSSHLPSSPLHPPTANTKSRQPLLPLVLRPPQLPTPIPNPESLRTLFFFSEKIPSSPHFISCYMGAVSAARAFSVLVTMKLRQHLSMVGRGRATQAAACPKFLEKITTINVSNNANELQNVCLESPIDQSFLPISVLLLESKVYFPK